MADSFRTIRTSLWLVVVACFCTQPAFAQEEEVPAPPGVREVPGGGIVGNMSCSSVTCHGRQEPQRRYGFESGQEFAHWMHDDPHAKAARTLQSQWFHDILVNASKGYRDDGKPDQRVYQQCAACHDPMGIAHASAQQSLSLPREAETLSTRGIGCESCHGKAEKWLSNHFRGESPQQLTGLGMIDLQDLSTRARQCSKCHVGDAEHDLPHDFYGAGHPPLQFEVTAYHALLKRKHWDEGKERRQTPELESRLWLAGQLAGMEGSLALLHKRAAAASKNGPWPEFAEYDCQGCHQKFAVVENKKSYGSFPEWRKWSYTSAGLIGKSFAAADVSPQINTIADAMKELRPASAAPVATDANSAAVKLQNLHLPRATTPLTSSLVNSAVADKFDGSQWGEQTQRYLLLIALESSGRDAFQLRPTGDSQEFWNFTRDFKARATTIVNELNRNPLKSTASSPKLSPAEVNQALTDLTELLQRRDQKFPISGQ